MSEPYLTPAEISKLHLVIGRVVIDANPKSLHSAFFAEWLAKRGDIAGDDWFLAIPLARAIEARFPDSVIDCDSLADALGGDVPLARASLRLAGAIERRYSGGLVRWEIGHTPAGSEPVRFPGDFLDSALANL